MRTTPFERHWRWCQQVRRAHRQAPEAEERDALTDGEAPLGETGGIILTTIYPSLNGTKSACKKVVYVNVALHVFLCSARGLSQTDPYSKCAEENPSKRRVYQFWRDTSVPCEETVTNTVSTLPMRAARRMAPTK